MASEPRYSLGQFTLALVPDTTTFRLRNPLMLLMFMLVCSFIFKIFIVLLEILSFYTFLYSRIYFKSLQKAKLLQITQMFLKQKLLNLFMSTKDYLKRVGKKKTTNQDGICAEYMRLSPRNPAHYKSRMPGAVSRLAHSQRIPIKVKQSMPYVRLGIPELFI